MDQAKQIDLSLKLCVLFGRNPPGGPRPHLARSFGIIISPKFQNPTMLVNHFHFFVTKSQTNHENPTFRESLESQGPRDLPSMKERKISYKMHRSRAPYDQMAPQLLCQFYVPGQPSKRQFVKNMVWWRYKNTCRIKGKSQLVLFVSDSNTNSIN